MATAPLDLDEAQHFRDACYAQYREQHKTHDVLRDPPPVIVQVLDALMDEIARLREQHD